MTIINHILAAFDSPTKLVLTLWFITAGLWLVWSPLNKTRREDAVALFLWVLANIAFVIRWFLSLGAGPIFGVTAKDLRRLRVETYLLSRPYYRQVGRW